MRTKDLAALKTLLALCVLLAPALGQTPAPRQPAATPAPQSPAQAEPAPPADEDEDVVRITSNLVQFDAVVYDKDDRQVTDLRPEEFEVTVGGKRQEITNFSYVSTVSGKAEARSAAARPGGPSAPPVPPARLRPEQVRRTVALVVDDLGTSFESMHFVRQALRKFVNEQMQPGDLVAVIRTSAGIGALQQFTTDKRILHKAIDSVRWYAMGRSGISAFGAIESDPLAAARAQAGVARTGREEFDNTGGGAETYREELFTVGTLGALNFIVRGMDELPGRKSIVVFSDGFKIFRREQGSLRTTNVIEHLRRLTDLATRAAVSVYTVDARGLPTLGLTAADSTTDFSAAQLEERLTARRDEHFDAQEGLRYMAEATGGAFLRGSNDLTRGIRRALDEQQGYYLIGFRPEAEVFDPEHGRARYNRFQVKLKRPGLKVRTRGGFYGVTDEGARPARLTRDQQLMAAITSPFASGDLGLRLTTLFSRGEKNDSVLDSVLHIDVSRFTVADDEGDWKKLVFDVVALTFGEEGRIVDSLNRTETIRMRGDALEAVMTRGLVYKMEVPLKKPGAYQLRVAVRDSATEKVGSASQFVEVPDLKNKRLALSSILLTSSPPETAAAAGASGATPTPRPAAAEGYSPLHDAAVRSFRQGGRVDFIYHIYNAKADKATARPQLQTQMRLFRDGQQVFEGTPRPYDASRQTDLARLAAGSRITLGSDLPPGNYVLQVAVTDALADRKHAVATQWIDFEIVK
jgi:VWFA-related protein